MPERFKVVFTMQGAIQVLGFTFTFISLARRQISLVFLVQPDFAAAASLCVLSLTEILSLLTH